MRLYSRMNATAHDDPEYGHFTPVTDDGGFDFPDDMAERTRRFHVRGKPAWESEDERALRLHGEEAARRRDPESLYNAVADIANLARAAAGQQAPAVPAEVTAELAELRKLVAELQAANAAAAAATSEQPPAKPSRSTSKAAKAVTESTGGNS